MTTASPDSIGGYAMENQITNLITLATLRSLRSLLARTAAFSALLTRRTVLPPLLTSRLHLARLSLFLRSRGDLPSRTELNLRVKVRVALILKPLEILLPNSSPAVDLYSPTSARRTLLKRPGLLCIPRLRKLSTNCNPFWISLIASDCSWSRSPSFME